MQLKEHLLHIIESLPRVVPETWLAFAFLLLITAELVLKLTRWSQQTSTVLWFSAFGLSLAGLLLVILQWNAPEGYLFHHLLYLDTKAVFFKGLILITTLFVLLHIRVTHAQLPPEFYAILLAIVLGLCFMTMAVNGLSLYLSIELVSIGSYLLASMGRGKLAAEGGIKYLLFGALSSGIMLYGLSFLYGMTGSLDLTSEVFANHLAQNHPVIILVVGFLTLGGVLFKLSLVPFHVWAPDVYEGAPTPIVAFLSTAPKAAALLLLMRLLSALPADFQQLMALLALSSILLGNLSALWQNDLKRLLAYSGIAQAGFVLVGVVAFSQAGFESATFYIVIYVLTNLAAFLLVDLVSSGRPTLLSLSGKGAQLPVLAVCFVIVMVALVGLPPTAGFTSKLLVFSALWEANTTAPSSLLTTLLVVGLLNAVISLVYYFKIPFYLFFKEAPEASHETPKPAGTALVVALTVLIVVLFLKTDWLMLWIKQL
ncbi:NADH-quinone oxidoreductase subunit N [Runella sp. SP2]|uniref:NADH-quinone oxidoreductase subunit N n=1 Tax=Runella sp. SP2 TaxID=2268026 RepID=UPI000F07F289|nr:NADH-quinone oxidoreductase subunit N [Runella sp. SP2]AYQ35282.1 NADH-quinone oxidoreductase subunit N [Runella sp. SP2]